MCDKRPDSYTSSAGRRRKESTVRNESLKGKLSHGTNKQIGHGHGRHV